MRTVAINPTPSVPVPDADYFESLYRHYNKREFIRPDPLELVLRYASAADREVAGLVSASLSYGRVQQILTHAGAVLDRMTPSPARYLKGATRRAMAARFRGFRHRWTTDRELVDLLWAIKVLREENASLQSVFKAGRRRDDRDVIPALSYLIDRLRCSMTGKRNSLLSHPADGSACKRLHMFLRWMIRKDAVDPGPWRGLPASGLLIPLDAHMHRIALVLGLTRRRQANHQTVLEITEAFRTLSPADPVRYDFVLTRFGIHPDLKSNSVFRSARAGIRVGGRTVRG